MTIYRNITIKSPHGNLQAELTIPSKASALVLITQLGEHPDYCPAKSLLLERQIAVLALDLLTVPETHHLEAGQNAILLAERLISAFDYCRYDGDTAGLHPGIFAIGRAAPAAVRAAAQRDAYVAAVVVRDGLIDHAGREYLEALEAPLLVLADTNDETLIQATQRAFTHLHAIHELRLISRNNDAEAVVGWFERWLPTVTR